LNLKKALAVSLLVFTAIFLNNDVALASGGGDELGKQLPLWSILPFVGMLLSIAIFPLVKSHWWEHNMAKVSAFWSLVFFIPFLIFYGTTTAIEQFLHIVILDYIPFIILLFGLFAVSGGIILRGSLKGTPLVNMGFLTIGTILASWIGTTGASMLLIRPMIRANEWRQKKTHMVVFFIFLVSNIGGSLTPVGDPPLFLGFLRGVPFFWTMNLIWPMAFNALILLAIYFAMDNYYYRKEPALGTAGQPLKAAEEKPEPLRVDGLHNVIFLAMIVGSVILSGILSKNPLFADVSTGRLYGITLFGHGDEAIVLPFVNIIRDSTILLAAFLSVKTTSKAIRTDNRFTWFPIKEVATLFIGIFITMIPALAILGARGSELGLTAPAHFFWATGALSSFLDNAPTYLVFMTTAASLGATEGLVTTVGTIAPKMLMAVSCGAVFMGANTYIGNAPNFMVRSIAEENKIKMPSFFGYMGWSIAFLIPLFIINTLIFFR
jgi:Na+/H+ antiporter NhaD/arsenite permease-like protein